MSMISKKDGNHGAAPNLVDIHRGQDKLAPSWHNPRMFNNPRCSSVFPKDIRRAAVLAVALALAGLVVSGCSSTGPAFKKGLVVPVIKGQIGSISGENGYYQPTRSPGFNDLTGS